MRCLADVTVAGAFCRRVWLTYRGHASKLDGTNPEGTVFKRILIADNGSAEGKYMLSRWWQRSIGKSLLDTSRCVVLVIRPPAGDFP